MRSEEFRSLCDHLPLPLIVLDPSGALLYRNGEFDRIYGADPDPFSRCVTHHNQQIELCDSWSGEITFDGTTAHLHLRALKRADTVSGYSLLFLPTSQQYRLELLGTLVGGIAHDLNNILTSVLGHVSFLKLSLPEGGSYSDSLAAVEEGARKAAATTQQILEFARGEQSKRRPVNLSLVVAAGMNLLRSVLPQGIAISVVEDSQDIFVFGDESQLSQVVMNLAINARDALPNGGKIRVRLARAVNSAGKELAQFVISDNGLGIPREIRTKIFEPFFTTKRGVGTGLGLTNVQTIVRSHGGTILVESEQGKGTSFEILLPLCVPEQENTDEPEELPRGDESILVVEDEETVRLVICRSLEHLGYRVESAESGEHALKIYRPGKYALVVLDMMMPGMSGDELFWHLQALDPGVRVLIASGYSGKTGSILEGGARGFLQKPFAVDDLAREVRRCIDEGLS